MHFFITIFRLKFIEYFFFQEIKLNKKIISITEINDSKFFQSYSFSDSHFTNNCKFE